MAFTKLFPRQIQTDEGLRVLYYRDAGEAKIEVDCVDGHLFDITITAKTAHAWADVLDPKTTVDLRSINGLQVVSERLPEMKYAVRIVAQDAPELELTFYIPTITIVAEDIRELFGV